MDGPTSVNALFHTIFMMTEMIFVMNKTKTYLQQQHIFN